MKKKFLQSAVLRLVVLLTAAIFTLAGCGDAESGSTGSSTPTEKSITITGAETLNGRSVELAVLAVDQTRVAYGKAITVSGGTVTFPLLDDEDDTEWTGTGNHLLVLTAAGELFDTIYGYSEGEAGASIDDLKPYNITDTNTIALSQFGKQPEPRTVTITGVSALDGDEVYLSVYDAGENLVNYNRNSITVEGDSVTFPLYADNQNTLWNGSGGYYLELETDSTYYGYTGSSSIRYDSFESLEPYTFSATNSIPFSEFGEVADPKTITITGINLGYQDGTVGQIELFDAEGKSKWYDYGNVNGGTFTSTGFNTVPAGDYCIWLRLDSTDEFAYVGEGGSDPGSNVADWPICNVNFSTPIPFGEFIAIEDLE